ncbi:hypothetical protein RBWH47_02037 [Rhodopirellula baltica WH47]|uniref:Uncharacterized protein n=1 Tax=Rhodopirellula baltica WH47 TaxID=991778 RepID=F2AS91_RHOBT|nr:hypothetical protein RBWH47_02037 [Rhodopirellula baltica WH47]
MTVSSELNWAAVTTGFGGEPAFMAANDYRIRLDCMFGSARLSVMPPFAKVESIGCGRPRRRRPRNGAGNQAMMIGRSESKLESSFELG